MNRLYVVEFESGVLKAGITTCFRTRAVALGLRFGRIVRVAVSEPVLGRGAESALLQRLCKIGCRRGRTETFEGIRFAVAAQIMRQVCSRNEVARGLSNKRPRRPLDRIVGGGELPVSESMRLVVVDWHLCAQHTGMVSPVPIDQRQLERWVLKQLRETVA